MQRKFKEENSPEEQTSQQNSIDWFVVSMIVK